MRVQRAKTWGYIFLQGSDWKKKIRYKITKIEVIRIWSNFQFKKSVGFPLSENINPADHYVWETAIMEGDEEGSYKKISAICGAYENSSTANSIMKEQIPHVKSDSVVQVQNNPGKNKLHKLYHSRWRVISMKTI